MFKISKKHKLRTKVWQTLKFARSVFCVFFELAEELDAPRQALEEKWASYCEKAVDDSRAPLVPMWTPAMQMMVSELPQVPTC